MRLEFRHNIHHPNMLLARKQRLKLNMLCCFFILEKGEHQSFLKEGWGTGASPAAAGPISKTGWSNSEVFFGLLGEYNARTNLFCMMVTNLTHLLLLVFKAMAEILQLSLSPMQIASALVKEHDFTLMLYHPY